MKTIILAAAVALAFGSTSVRAENIYTDAPSYNAHSSFGQATWQHIANRPARHAWSPFTALEIIFGAEGGSDSGSGDA